MTEAEKDDRKVLERLMMFNDAVYAIALTLLVLELKLPEGVSATDPNDMLHHLGSMTPRFLAFLLSVILVGSNWFSSINIQRTMVRSNHLLIITMIIYLTIISIMPFCCNIIGSYPDNPISYVIFGVVSELLLINAIFFLRNNRMNNLYHEGVDMNEISKLEKSLPFTAVFNICMIATAFYSTKLTFILFLGYNLLPFFLSRSLRVNHKETM